MRRDPGSGLALRARGYGKSMEALALMAIAQREAEQEAYEAAQRSGRYGVLVLKLDGGADTFIGVHTGVPRDRTWIRHQEPEGKFLPKTVHRFLTASAMVE